MSHRIYSDTQKNYLYIEIGVIEAKNYDLFKYNLINEAAPLKTGFKCITDLRSFHISNTQNKNFHKIINFVQDELKKRGVGIIIRIVHPQAMFIAQLLLEDIEKKNKTSFVTTIKEAVDL